MKKLMMMLGAVALAASVQAATYNWSFGTTAAIYDGYNATAVGGQSANAAAGLSAYLILGSYAQSSLLSDLRDGKSITDAAGANILASATSTASGISSTAFTTDSSLVGSDGKMSAYLAVISADGNYVGLVASKSVTADTAGGTSAFSFATNPLKYLRDNDGSKSYSTPGWYSAVPEPTSGLLMLVGLAGLALRRRRA
jgi:hypothetical protein